MNVKKQGYQPKYPVHTLPPNRGSSVQESSICNKCKRILALEEKINKLEREILK